METSFRIVMQDLTEDYLQKPMISEQEAKTVLDSLARLHAHFWDIEPQVERGSFWVLERRKPFGGNLTILETRPSSLLFRGGTGRPDMEFILGQIS